MAALRALLDFRPALVSGEGIGRYALELGRALERSRAVDLRLFGATWAAAPHAPDVRNWQNARLFRARVPSKALLGALRGCGAGVERLFRGGADLAHHTQYRRLPTRLPEVATIHDLVYLDSDRYVGRDVARRMSEFARGAARTARVIVTPSNAVADEVAERLDVPRERVVPTPLGVDHVLSWGRPPRAGPGEPGSDRPGPGHRGPYVLTVGRIEPRKNHLGVLRALEALGEDSPRWVVAGPKGDGAEDFTRAVERSPIADRIELLGRVSESALRALVESALALVLVPFDEGFGLAPLEAMRLGTPAVTADVPVVREVCGGGAALVDPDNIGGIAAAIAQVTAGGPGAAALRERARAHASSFDWARTAEATVSAYRAALGS